jgi:hypothetical protein
MVEHTGIAMGELYHDLFIAHVKRWKNFGSSEIAPPIC